jgi:hypothetical protein
MNGTTKMSTIKTIFDDKKATISNISVWFFLSGFFAIFYYEMVLYPHLNSLPSWFRDILDGNADSPYNYRLLIPALFTLIGSISSLPLKLTYFIATFVVFLFSIGSLMRAISFSMSNVSSVVALLFASFFILLTFPNAGHQPWSYVDIGLYSLAYIAVVRAWSAPSYILILLIALLNRETGILLCVVPLLVQIMKSGFKLSITYFKKEIIVLISGLVFFLAIRIFQGSSAHVSTVAQIFSQNFEPQTFIINIFVYASAFFWFFTGKKTTLSHTEKAFLIIFSINIILVLFFGLFREIRMFVPFVFLFGLLFARKVH